LRAGRKGGEFAGKEALDEANEGVKEEGGGGDGEGHVEIEAVIEMDAEECFQRGGDGKSDEEGAEAGEGWQDAERRGAAVADDPEGEGDVEAGEDEGGPVCEEVHGESLL
jgi:hypothetical protein